MILLPKNWAEFQHYKDRSPAWIKLHRSLLDDFEFQSMPVTSRALAPMLWLIASENDRGEINAAPKKLAFRLRTQEREIAEAIQPLIDAGFFVVLQDDSAPLAQPAQPAIPEKEKRREREEEKAREFAQFWDAYPRKEAKQDALKAWGAVTAKLETILAAVNARRKSEDWTRNNGQFIPLPATYLRGKRWEDVGTEAPATVAKGPDPALAKLDADAKVVRAPTPAERAAMASLSTMYPSRTQ